jgi:hypothetical protein
MVGIDRVAIPGVPGARLLVGDVFTVVPADLLGDAAGFDVVMSDMAPDTTGIRHLDQARSEALFERALELATRPWRRAGASSASCSRARTSRSSSPRAGAVRHREGHEARVESPDLDRAVRDRGRLQGARAVSALRLIIEPWGEPPARKIAKAVEILHGGGVAAYPTDSVYALGCAIEAATRSSGSPAPSR